ncbi:hypothetical protein TESG_01309 [Trichophyton tonsurans CBS 112818]|uniref:BZIP transcription factor n=1 Tax=Trichophyton tonsurans (strain CBS 112818) TaxID=647933 RepID=F2RR27_TRIT1|nr:hypothetical protein TESG_01309 [Trichophyton tonsurans CBS 112818]
MTLALYTLKATQLYSMTTNEKKRPAPSAESETQQPKRGRRAAAKTPGGMAQKPSIAGAMRRAAEREKTAKEAGMAGLKRKLDDLYERLCKIEQALIAIQSGREKIRGEISALRVSNGIFEAAILDCLRSLEREIQTLKTEGPTHEDSSARESG